MYVMYWLPEQLHLYKEACKSRKINSISIAATGSLIKPIVKPDGSKGTIFLYQAVAPYNNKVLPLAQMISEKHDANTLTYWLREWIRMGAKIPT